MPRKRTTPEPASVWDSVPEVASAERLLEQTTERLAALPAAPPPEEARQAIIEAAVEALRTDGTPMPPDIGERAAQAHIAALAPHAEYLALSAAVNSLRRRIPFLKSRGSRTILEALAGRLEDVLTEVRTITERSGPLTAETAIEGGEQSITDYTRLRELVGTVDDIRKTQRQVYAAVGDAGVLASLYAAGHDQFRGVSVAQHGESRFRAAPDPNELPTHVKAVVEGRRRRDVPFLLYMAQSGRAWLPVDVEELADEAHSAEDVGSPEDGRNPFWQREVTVAEPSTPQRSLI